MINQLKKKSILVIGDVMLDIYYNGEVKRISPEAPVPVFRKKSERSVLGGAANVAANLIAANQDVSILTVIGADENGKKLKTTFIEKGINIDLVLETKDNTTVKTRLIADNNQQVLRLDIEDIHIIKNKDSNFLLNALGKKIGCFDLILISDYMKGLLSLEFTQEVLNMAREHNIPVIIDVKDPKIEKYKGAYLLKPNLKELQDLTGMITISDEEIIRASQHLRKLCNCKYVLTTCGAKGMVLVGEKEPPYFIPSEGKELYDVTGAGDTTIAYIAACIANGLNIHKSVYISNCAAGIQVAKVGTSSVSWEEVRKYLADNSKEDIHRILKGNDVKNFRLNHKDKKIVFTNGCFDILHIGHIRYLKQAAALGDLLVIGLNSDNSIKRFKGLERPINNEQDRAELLCALEFVDYVVIFNNDTPYELIKIIQPDILVKGGDYQPEEVVGKDIVEDRGGELIIIPFVKGKSTTKLIEKIRN